MKLMQLRRNVWICRALLCLFILLALRIGFLNYNEPTEIGVARNLLTGKIWVQNGGWHLECPWVLVPHIDTRPMRVSVDSAGHGYRAKLVRFVPSEWESFVKIEGWRLWWFSNRLSFNFGYEDEHRGLKDIFRGYAYGTKKYSFLVILEEFGEQE